MNPARLSELASRRDTDVQNAITEMVLDPPNSILREMRFYLSRRVDSRRIENISEKVIVLNVRNHGITALICPEIEFLSGAKLKFEVEMESTQVGWKVKSFEFHLSLPESTVKMIQFHMMGKEPINSLDVPRCHLHIGTSKTHLPFPFMDPRLILYLICDHLERDSEL